MNCDNCRWFNKTGFVPGFGDCVLNREVHGSNHVCKNYEEYEPRPHGKWVQVTCKDGEYYCYHKCTNCGQTIESGFDNPPIFNYCPNCGALMVKEGEVNMMEKRKLSQFEKIMLASAYNLKNYCKNRSCSDCIFIHGVSTCILTTPDNPYNWELYQIDREEGEAE